MNSIILYGIDNFVGKNIALHYQQKQIKVIGFTLKSEQNISFYQQILELLKAHPNSVFIHAVDQSSGTLAQLHHAHITSTKTICSILEQYAPHVPFIYLSSIHAQEKLNLYGRIKYQAEQVIEKSTLTHWQIIRSSLLYGPYDKKNLYWLIHAVQKWPFLLLPGAYYIKLHPLYIYDFTALLLKLIQTSENKQYHKVIGPEQLSLYKLARIIQTHFQSTQQIFNLPSTPLQYLQLFFEKYFKYACLPLAQMASCMHYEVDDNNTQPKKTYFQFSRFEENIKKLKR